jgi:hypothetical protein
MKARSLSYHERALSALSSFKARTLGRKSGELDSKEVGAAVDKEAGVYDKKAMSNPRSLATVTVHTADPAGRSLESDVAVGAAVVAGTLAAEELNSAAPEQAPAGQEKPDVDGVEALKGCYNSAVGQWKKIAGDGTDDNPGLIKTLQDQWKMYGKILISFYQVRRFYIISRLFNSSFLSCEDRVHIPQDALSPLALLLFFLDGARVGYQFGASLLAVR